jgi:uncharacterized protein (TIGR02270 family)
MATISPDLILWDVVQEHLEEAEFLLGQWEDALRSPKYSLIDLGATLEKRLEAHLDGLLLGGPEVAVRVLCPNLENADEPGKATVSALALLFDRQDETVIRLLDLLEHAEGPLEGALAKAMVLANVPHLDRLLLDRLRSSRLGPQDAVLLEILTERRVEIGDVLYTCLRSDNPRILSAALHAIGSLGRRDMRTFAERYLSSDVPALRASALCAGVALGSRAAWFLCLELAGSASDCEPSLLVAMLGRPVDHQILYKQLDDPVQLERTLWNIGFCGTVQAGDVCAAHLEGKDPRVAKVAAESMAWIGGFDFNAPQFQGSAEEPGQDETLPPIEQDDLDRELTLDGVDDLPVPNPAAITRWWEENRRQLTDNRHILGRPYSPAAIVHAADNGPLWRCGGLARELSIRSGLPLSTAAFSSRRRREIAALAGADLTRWHLD